jgi:uncharacterized protein (DUF1015 family)
LRELPKLSDFGFRASDLGLSPRPANRYAVAAFDFVLIGLDAMPQIRPIPAVQYASVAAAAGDITRLIAPPYDVLDERSKAQLLKNSKHNIVAVDLPFLPPKTVGPDEVYRQAGERYRKWLKSKVLFRRETPALFAYQQTYTVADRTFKRRGLIANVRTQTFGPAPDGKGGVWPHEQTFAAAKEDRLKLMRATRAQLSPIFGIFSDEDGRIGALLNRVTDGPPSASGATAGDGVLHEIWAIDTDQDIGRFTETFAGIDVFIADGHHRYNTALNYRNELVAEQGELPEDHPANGCLFVMVSMQDPGMIVLPTHRVLGGMNGFSMARLREVAGDKLNIATFAGNDLSALEKALPDAGPHAMGLYDPSNADSPLSIATTLGRDPMKNTHRDHSAAWRQLDVAILQHLLVESICEPTFCAGEQVTWKFPHSLDELKSIADGDGYQLGVVMQATPLDSVRKISEAGELMPQKSTFFYPKLATGLVINPLE